MDLNQVLELLGQEHLPGDETTGAFLDDAVASFAVNPAATTPQCRLILGRWPDSGRVGILP
jgi:hypothetical protein